MDIFEKCYSYTAAKEAIEGGYYPYFIPLTESEGSEVVYQGHRLIMCGSNNYLGLTTHPDVKKAARNAIDQFGTSCTGSRFLNGTLELHEQLEDELADFVGKESALVFSTGMQTNLGTISAIVGRGDLVILDREDHASIVDGARLGWGDLKRFRHNDMDDLENLLKKLPDEKGKLIVVDGLYSMEGDIAPLPELVPLAKKYGARVMVDDAHALGTLGKGKGTAAHFGMTDDVDLIMSTFSKSLASIGGFIAGDEDVIHYIKHHARSLIFSASIPAANAASSLAALKLIRENPELVDRVNEVADKVRAGLQGMGFDTGNSNTPIIPVIVGDDLRTIGLWKALFDGGVFVNPVISPAVQPGRQMLRTSYMASHTDEQIDQILEIFEQAGKQIGMIQ